MSAFEQDIKEITDCIINACLGMKKEYEECVSYMTKDSSEPFLQKRAEAIRNALSSNEGLLSAFKRLASYCNGVSGICDNCVVRKYCNSYIEHCRNTADRAALQMVDLFCGAGGLSLGFSQEGFMTALANDIEPCCVDTYAHNHPETPRDHIVLGDIREVVDHLEDLLAGKNIDIIVGGPPCQGFSMANRQRLIDDPRNHLYKSFVEVVKRVQPRFFVMENVKGMLSVADQVIEDFERIGYAVAALFLLHQIKLLCDL